MRVIDQLSFFWVVVYLVILVAAAVAATVFPFLYATMVRWWESPMGKYMMFKGIVLALTLDLSVSRLFVPELPVWVSFALLGLVAIMLWWMLILFIVTYVKGKRTRKHEREDRQQEEG